MIDELERLSDIGSELGRRARARGALLIWRAQVRSLRSVSVRRGRQEHASSSSTSGHGLQVVLPEGRTALASRDDLRPEPALDLLDRVSRVAAGGASLGLHTSRLPDLAPVRGRRVPDQSERFLEVDLVQAARRLAELESEIAAETPEIALHLTFRAELDAWRIFRSDGTDVLFAMPRCTLGLRATTGGDGSRHGVSTVVFGTRPDLPWQVDAISLFLKRARGAARLARELPTAPTHPAGSFPLVIDYALAKGLAHEAFGHAAEADGYRSSVLAREGRFKVGERVGADHVSIIDEPIEDDYAWQPYSSNGLLRERASVVDHGRLADGLSDPWSAGPGGVRLTGASRAASFRHAPLPRMSNIRIEVDGPLAAPGEFEDYGPAEVRDLLSASGLLDRHRDVVYLSGYTGGQVNPAQGDFVFNCQAIYRLGRDRISLYKPAIFSGSMFGALRSARCGWTPWATVASGARASRRAEAATISSRSTRSPACGWEARERRAEDGIAPGSLRESGGRGEPVNLEPLLAELASFRADGCRVRGWSISGSEGWRLTLGVKDREIGNAHAPLAVSESCGAGYLVIWDDGRVSRGHLERRQIESEPRHALEVAHAVAYDDPDAAHVLGPAPIPEVPIHDEPTAAMARGVGGLLAERLDSVRRCVDQLGLRTWSGSFAAGEGEIRVATSAGLDVTARGTSTGWHVTFDGEIGDGFSARAPESAAEFEARLARLAATLELLRRRGSPVEPGLGQVILHPSVVRSFVLSTLLDNLSGSRVAHGEGRFRPEQFGAETPVLRQDLCLRLDPLKPLRSGSYRFTGEGLPAARCSYIERGRLVAPIVDVKYAHRLGRPPTPIPYAMDVLTLGGPLPLPHGDAIDRARGGALILSVLGVHTQDSASGDFSLSAPQALSIGPAGLVGRVRGTISGNLFDVLLDDRLELVDFEGDETPGMLFPCRLDLAPA